MAGPREDLLHVWPGDISKEDLQALVDEKIPEGFQIEYKRQMDDGTKVLRAICAMANTFGGLVLVGIDEDRGNPANEGFGVPGPEGIVGVEPKEKSRLSTFCSNKLVPPFDPEIAAVEIRPDRVVLVVKVDTRICPRPLAFENRVLVRTESGNRPADLFRLRSLFAEESDGHGLPFVPLSASPHSHPSFNEADRADFVVRCVASAPIAASTWSPIMGDGERGRLRDLLRASELEKLLAHLAFGGGLGDLVDWTVVGLNLSKRIELGWWPLRPTGSTQPCSPTSRIVVDFPTFAGSIGPTRVDVTTDVVFRLSERTSAALETPGPRMRRHLSDLFFLFQALLALYGETLTEVLKQLIPVPVGPLGGLAVGIRAHPQLNLSDVLITDQLTPIADTQAAGGSELLAFENLSPRGRG